LSKFLKGQKFENFGLLVKNLPCPEVADPARVTKKMTRPKPGQTFLTRTHSDVTYPHHPKKKEKINLKNFI